MALATVNQRARAFVSRPVGDIATDVIFAIALLAGVILGTAQRVAPIACEGLTKLVGPNVHKRFAQVIAPMLMELVKHARGDDTCSTAKGSSSPIVSSSAGVSSDAGGSSPPNGSLDEDTPGTLAGVSVQAAAASNPSDAPEIDDAEDARGATAEAQGQKSVVEPEAPKQGASLQPPENVSVGRSGTRLQRKSKKSKKNKPKAGA
eukprot:CAMPEP_0185169878 /NCGR_PEP_ID=MMETSP1139-20130426/17887_1 /TAXON_ID=298111 /ORGANISM="Pavlova sp., Strain CCMP459" /LENGTH=204 /DNA_ID=CAMNT_0027735425 /DNA_START=9 /DNA_END=623 /DNA_ORIENTATION=-